LFNCKIGEVRTDREYPPELENLAYAMTYKKCLEFDNNCKRCNEMRCSYKKIALIDEQQLSVTLQKCVIDGFIDCAECNKYKNNTCMTKLALEELDQRYVECKTKPCKLCEKRICSYRDEPKKERAYPRDNVDGEARIGLKSCIQADFNCKACVDVRCPMKKMVLEYLSGCDLDKDCRQKDCWSCLKENGMDSCETLKMLSTVNRTLNKKNRANNTEEN
jgi:hypothetical protein